MTSHATCPTTRHEPIFLPMYVCSQSWHSKFLARENVAVTTVKTDPRHRRFCLYVYTELIMCLALSEVSNYEEASEDCHSRPNSIVRPVDASQELPISWS